MKKIKEAPYLDQIDAFVFDFDGVLTNNLVYLDSNGKESVACSRADGLAFDVLRKLDKPAYILSTERNQVVKERASKLKIEAIQSIENKASAITELSKNNGYSLSKIFYVGNDINDFHVMSVCGFTACPNDSHEIIKDISDYILNENGGNGVVREILEELLGLDLIKILYGF